MRYMSATDAKQNFAALLDDAQRGPVVIRRQSRDQFCDQVGQHATDRGLTEHKLKELLRDDG